MAVDDIEIHRRGFDVLDDAGSNKIQIAVLDKVASKACGIFEPCIIVTILAEDGRGSKWTKLLLDTQPG